MNSNSMKSIQFSINKTVRVTRIFIKEGHYLTTNEPIFTMVDTDNPSKSHSIQYPFDIQSIH